jgi:hypothetical protein
MSSAVATHTAVSALFDIEISDQLGAGLRIGEHFWITNAFSAIRSRFDAGFVNAIGNIEWAALNNAKAVVHWNLPLNAVPGDEDSVAILNRFLHDVALFLTALWLVKDNSTSSELGFAQVEDGPLVRYYSNFLAKTIRRADGRRTATKFTRSELRRASSLWRESLLPLGSTDLLLVAEDISGVKGPRFASNKAVKRITRAVYFLSSARAMPDLGSKIVDYCTVLEVLFSTDSTEITHKIAHRVAVFLGGSRSDKLKTFSAVKQAYSVRSKVVHGDIVAKNTIDKVGVISSNIDEVVRRILHRLLESPQLLKQFEEARDSLDRYFLESSFE